MTAQNHIPGHGFTSKRRPYRLFLMSYITIAKVIRVRTVHKDRVLLFSETYLSMQTANERRRLPTALKRKLKACLALIKNGIKNRAL
jgi:hypothetical protein